MRPTARQSMARSYFASVIEAFALSRGEAPRAVDPTWFAHRGYVASAGLSGGGHLAWERIGARFQRLRLTFRANARPFDDHKAAFAMGFGLGLVDGGYLSTAEGEELVEALLPAAGPRPAIRTAGFWLSVGLTATAVAAIVVILEGKHPIYPVLTAPLLASSVNAPLVVQELPRPANDPEGVRAVNEAAASGTVRIGDALARIATLEKPVAEAAALDLYRRVLPKDRLELLSSLTVLPPAVSRPVYRMALSDVSETVLERALGAVVGQGDTDSIPLILALLKRQEASIRCLASESLGVLLDKERASHLLALLKDPEDTVRRCARRALTKIVGKDYGNEPKKWLEKLRRFSQVDKKTVHEHSRKP